MILTLLNVQFVEADNSYTFSRELNGGNYLA